ncbi:MAG: hypothetical protein A3H97_23935 [Acidobacteria bacterium RIFCSPLOWO2_02_FULL_65_29]|nr:MAG: hypothetical protein A3H97_23935 [Acidobacteria bacterium RIFCSPLOWO2_02_FULL_65_29]
MTFAAWLHHTPLSLALQSQVQWLWPLCEGLHFAGLALLVGVAGMFDLRLLGFMKRVPVAVVQEFMPWAVLGFGINLVTGLVFVVSEPAQYFSNPTWWVKVAFIVVSGINAVVYQFAFGARAARLAPGDDTPMSFKVIGAVSLVSWFAVLWAGRMLPFIGAAIGAGL